jgi:hypothetical protein
LPPAAARKNLTFIVYSVKLVLVVFRVLFIYISLKGGGFMAKKRKDFCPICGKEEFSREPTGKINYDAGGWHERCPVCQSLLWVSADPTKPIEEVVVPAGDVVSFEPETIIFSSAIKLLEAMSRGEEI